MKKNNEALLILCTYGGDPDAAYKIGRYLQSKYEKFSILVAGLCKRAGTLLAISGNEIIFSPYGELGPLDIQISKIDNIAGQESGLNIRQAFETLETQATEAFHKLIVEIVGRSGGIVSFQTAAHSAAELVSRLYGPIFGRIDPEEVGSKSRAMQIAAQYSVRLNARFGNLKPNSIHYLVQTFPSHAFVIDLAEAQEIFERAREANVIEKALVDRVGLKARFPAGTLLMLNLTAQYLEILQETQDGQPLEPEIPPEGGAGRQPDLHEGNRGAPSSKGKPKADGAEAAVG